MATPTMVLPPLIVNALSKEGRILAKNPALANPVTVSLFKNSILNFAEIIFLILLLINFWFKKFIK